MIEEVKIIQPAVFSKYENLVCGVSTRYGPDSKPPLDFNLSFKVGDNPDNVRQNRKNFFNALGIDGKKVTFQFQTHSTVHNYVEETTFFNGSDGLYTDKKDLFLAINVADCIPVFVYDPVNEIAAGIHSGWKGTQQKIVTHTIQTLFEKYNSKPEELIVYIGPGISVKNFEVGKDVFDLFDEEFREVRNGKYYVDLKKDIYTRLIKQGLNGENIEVSEYCTVEDKELFHSFRRDREKSGRMLGVIGMKSK
jgi:YfiH family protein